jgi:hypothetical protein
MNLLDYIGERGEALFPALITKWCDGEPWFTQVVFLGGKAETKDFMVNLIAPTCGDATFYVQVKATTTGYSGKGASRKLKVKVDKATVEKLKETPGPAFVVGIDIDKESGFIAGITSATKGAISGIPIRHPLNCRAIRKLWNEVNDYWNKKKMLPASSKFSP